MARNRRETIVGITAGSTWGTGVNLGALDGVYMSEVDPLSLDGEIVPDEPMGCAEVEDMELVTENVEPTFTEMLRREGSGWKPVAGIFGDDTVTGAGPYTHTMNWQTNTGLFYTVGVEINDSDIV